MASELVTISSEALTARINPLGAELWSLEDSGRREYMTRGDPRFWTGHAPLLFPIVGGLNGGKYRLDGRQYALPKHGFARTSRFDVLEVQANKARLELRDNEETRAAYPLAFALQIEFVLAAQTLSVVATVRNRDQASAMPFSFGFHPAFAWPLPDGGAKDAHRVVFAESEPEPIRRIDPVSATLLPQPEPTPVTGNVLRPDPALFERDALIWVRLNSRALTFTGEGAALHLAFPDCPNLGIWQKPGAPFLALEPWHGFNDPQGFIGDFRDKPGIVELAPGAARSFRMDVTVRPG